MTDQKKLMARARADAQRAVDTVKVNKLAPRVKLFYFDFSTHPVEEPQLELEESIQEFMTEQHEAGSWNDQNQPTFRVHLDDGKILVFTTYYEIVGQLVLNKETGEIISEETPSGIVL